MSNTTVKACSVCGESRPSGDFTKSKRNPDGLSALCRSCAKVKAAAYYAANKAQVQARVREWQATNRALHLRNVHAYQESNREACRVRALRYRTAQRDKLTAYHREWSAANPERVAAKAARRRALKRGASTVAFTLEDVAARVAYYGGRCWMCRGPFEHLDHVKPLNKGGAHMLANLRPACARCNSSKKDKWPGVNRLQMFIR